MKWIVLGVAMNRTTRKTSGPIRAEVIDAGKNQLFEGCRTPFEIEQAFESFWNGLNPGSEDIVKCVGVERMK